MLALDIFNHHKKLVARTGVNASGWLRAFDYNTYGIPGELNSAIGFINFCTVPSKIKNFYRKRNFQSLASLVVTCSKTIKWMSGFCLASLKPHVNSLKITIHLSSLISSSCLLARQSQSMDAFFMTNYTLEPSKMVKCFGKVAGVSYQFFSLLVVGFGAQIPVVFIRSCASVSILSTYALIFLRHSRID